MPKQKILLGDNLDGELDGNILTVRIDLSKVGELTESRKSFRIATTNGNNPIPNHPDTKVRLGINAYKLNK